MGRPVGRDAPILFSFRFFFSHFCFCFSFFKLIRDFQITKGCKFWEKYSRNHRMFMNSKNVWELINFPQFSFFWWFTKLFANYKKITIFQNLFPNYKKSSLIQKGLLTQKLFMNSKTMRAFQKMFVWTKQMFMHLKNAQNFKTNVCRLEKMFVDSKVFHV